MGVTISISSITQNSQSIVNNTSNVTVTLIAKWTYGSWNHLGTAKGSLTIDGTAYAFTCSKLNPNKTTSGSQTLITKTVNVAHASDGSKTLSCSASFNTGLDSTGTVTTSASKVLTTIPRKSTLTAGNGTLGVAQTLTVSRKSTSFTHTIQYKCGSVTGSICTKSSSTSISWTPSESLARQNTSGITLSVELTIITYNGSTNIGSEKTTITLTIPSSMKPSCTLTVSDATEYTSIYGKAVKGYSKFNVSVTATTSYDSPITGYSTTVAGKRYTATPFTTDPITSSGNVIISSTVTDKRGRSGTAEKTIEVLDYTGPRISKLTVHRCDEDGTPNEQGEFVKAVFSYAVSTLNNMNSCQSSFKYKKTADETYTTVELPLDNQFAVTDYEYIFAADTSSSYDVTLTVTDELDKDIVATSASSGFSLMHFHESGNGVGIGKISELDGVLDIGFMTRFYGGILPMVLEPETDLDNVRTNGSYVGANVTSYNYSNCPLTSGTFALEVASGGEAGQVRQRLTRCHKTDPTVWERWYYTNSWGEWMTVSSHEFVLYSHATNGINTAVTLSETSANFKYLEIYFADNNGYSKGYLKHYVPNGLKSPNVLDLSLVEASTQTNTIWRRTRYTLSGKTLSPNISTSGYISFNVQTETWSEGLNQNYIYIYRVVGIR